MKKLTCLVLSILILASTVIAYALSYDELLQKAEEYIASEDYEKAFACYELAVKSEPENATAYIKAGLLHLERGNISDAGKSIETALSIDTTSSDAWLAKCRIDIALEDAAAFNSDVLYAEICGADLSEYTVVIGEMYAKTGYPEKAIEYFSKVSIDTLNDGQKALYRRALISCGEKEKAVALGLAAIPVRSEKLDAAFDSHNPKLVETETVSVKPEVSDFEIPDDAKAFFNGVEGMEDIEASLAEALHSTEFILLSKSPSGNSGLISAGAGCITVYNGKYHIPYPSAKSVTDEHMNLDRYYNYFNSRFRSLIGDEGIVYSSDGRYAAICNKRITVIKMDLFLDPILIDLSTGELILTATYPNRFLKEENAGAVTSAFFSSDGKYFYYILYGRFDDARVRLYRYNLRTGETELCLESEKNIYYPHLAELEDGSILMLEDVTKKSETEGFVVASYNDGVWSMHEVKLPLNRTYCYSNQLMYSSNAGLVCLVENILGGYSVGFQLINPNDDFNGISKFWCIKKDTNEIVSLSSEEYQASIDPDTQGKEEAFNLSLLYPYQTILNAVFSPDGNYMLLNTMSHSAKNESRNLFLIRLEDMTLEKISGLDAAKILVSSMGMNYPMNIEWNTDELIIGTDDGIKTFEFAAGN